MWIIRSFYKNKEVNASWLGSYAISDLKTLKGVKNRLNKYLLKEIEQDFKLRNLELCRIEISYASDNRYDDEKLVEVLNY